MVGVAVGVVAGAPLALPPAAAAAASNGLCCGDGSGNGGGGCSAESEIRAAKLAR